MVTVHIEGLSIGVFDHTRQLLRVCMLNAGFNETLRIPHHIQSLIVRRQDLVTPLNPPKGNVKGRLSSVRFREADHAAWDLSGMMPRIDGGSGLPEKKADTLSQAHPDPITPDWSPLHWVIPFDRYLPGCKVSADAQQIGEMTSAIVEISGGACHGSSPATLGPDADKVWFFNLKTVQAVTDTMDVRFDAAPSIELRNAAGESLGSIVVKDGAEIWLSNEATDRDIQLEKTVFNPDNPAHHGRHLKAYFEVLTALRGSDPPAMPVKVAAWKPSAIVSGTFCIVGRADHP